MTATDLQDSKSQASGQNRYLISKKPSKSGLGQFRKDRDYKPHNHAHIEDSPAAKRHGLDPLFRKSEMLKMERVMFAESIAEPEPEEAGADFERTAGRGAERQIDLDQWIYWIQNTASVAEGYFIYLRQNPDNDKNPYDLVYTAERPGQPESSSRSSVPESKREGRQSQTPRPPGSRSHERNPVTDRDGVTPRDQNRASQN